MMYFLKSTAVLDVKELMEKREITGDITKRPGLLITSLNQSGFRGTECTFFVCECFGASIGACIAGDISADDRPLLEELWTMMGIDFDTIRTENISFREFITNIKKSLRFGYINDVPSLIHDPVLRNAYVSFDRFMRDRTFVREKFAKPEETAQVSKEPAPTDSFSGSSSFRNEMERIELCSQKKAPKGQPVHYVLSSGDGFTAEKGAGKIINALYSKGRLASPRYTVVYPFSAAPLQILPDEDAIPVIYGLSEDGAVVINLTGIEDAFGNPPVPGTDTVLKNIAGAVKRNSLDVLTAIIVPKGAETLADNFLSLLESVPFVYIKSDVLDMKESVEVLDRLAEKYGVEPDDELKRRTGELKSHAREDVEMLFKDWYGEKLRTEVYPQYRSLGSYEGAEAAETSSAEEELENMTGLSQAKDVIFSSVNYFRAQKLFQDKGFSRKKPSMHMVFSGSPGTGKTTVARLFARIMKDNGIIENGSVVETGRGDLVGKYIGHTAQKVRESFTKAEGGVLFIDEAYSLLDDREGSYGDEAINTIVQEMENRRDSVCVIFAGYSDKMEKFLDRNPGLDSRIGFHVPFEDYSVEEMKEILLSMAAEDNLSFDDAALEKTEEVILEEMKKDNFGNGRFARNLIEKIKLTHASRLLEMDYDDVTEKDVVTISEEDVPSLNMQKPLRETARIGFN